MCHIVTSLSTAFALSGRPVAEYYIININASQLIIFTNIFYVLLVRLCAISAIGHNGSHFTCARAACKL